MTEPVLSLRGLTVTLHRNGAGTQVLDGIDLDVAPGEIVALVGESGSGKSTIGLAVQGLLAAEAAPIVGGAIRLAGEELTGASAERMRLVRRDRVRAVFQDPMGALDPTMTIRRQMAEAVRDPAESAAWLERAGLADPERILAAFPHTLSGGQRQRVLIGMAMAAGPALLIADEPTTALDVTIQAQILDLIRDLCRERGTAVLFITHDLGVAASLADRIAVLYGGRVVEDGPATALLARPGHPYAAGLVAARFALDADRSRPLPTLPGEPPGSPDTSAHCGFANRCPIVVDPCRIARPPLAPTPAHAGRAACFRTAEAGDALDGVTARDHWPAPAVVAPGYALEMAGVTKSFAAQRASLLGRRKRHRVLDGVDLRIARGESVALVGESGSGKSTILRIAAGLIAPDDGDVARGDRGQPQIVFQDSTASLTPWLRAGEQIAERLRPLRLAADERRRRVREALDLVGLEPAVAEALPSELSGGQCQRVAVARAVIVPPSLLLCDEPISAMDVSLAAQALNLIGGLRRRLGIAMLFVTHDLAAARIVADRIVVLREGRIVEDGDADAVVHAPVADYTRRLIAAMPGMAQRTAA
jgi:peptide/nickel transport system ATP-binding protein